MFYVFFSYLSLLLISAPPVRCPAARLEAPDTEEDVDDPDQALHHDHGNNVLEALSQHIGQEFHGIWY